ncbi:hypothetical protein L204_100041 [Cryptococcus depauperatus]|nr:hypothetical protein L204_02478 [Cryptococcus depauperatus CBS 7855]
MPTAKSNNKHPAGPVATSSKITLDAIPPADIPESITAGYVWEQREREPLDQEERNRFIHELIGYDPKDLTKDISEAARSEVYNIVSSIENWAYAMSKDPDTEAELSTGLHALETLLESHMDNAFDKFEGWALRNPFDFPADLEVALPWHKGLDFQRGEYVVANGGKDALDRKIESLRTQVEQARFLSQRLEIAEKRLDRRIEMRKQHQAQVGFVKEVVDAAGLQPLPIRASQIQQTLSSLQTSLPSTDALDLPIPASSVLPHAGEHTKAWELGRAAYLNWALGKVVPPRADRMVGGDGGAEEKLEAIEKAIQNQGGREGIEILARKVDD